MLDELNEVLNTDNTLTVGVGVGGATYTHLVQDFSSEIIAMLTIAFISVKLIIAVVKLIIAIIMGVLDIILKYKECKKNKRTTDKL